MRNANGGFGRGLRPKPRVRPSTAEDLAVVDVTGGWLADSRHVICCLPGCNGHRIPLDTGRENVVAGMAAHREGCRP